MHYLWRGTWNYMTLFFLENLAYCWDVARKIIKKNMSSTRHDKCVVVPESYVTRYLLSTLRYCKKNNNNILLLWYKVLQPTSQMHINNFTCLQVLNLSLCSKWLLNADFQVSFQCFPSLLTQVKQFVNVFRSNRRRYVWTLCLQCKYSLQCNIITFIQRHI